MSNLHIDELLDTAYKLAIENYSDSLFTFSSIWSKVWKSATDFKKESVEDWIGVFYTELLLDPRFVNFANDKWRLKEFMDFADYKKLEKLLIQDEKLFDEDYEKMTKVQPQTTDDEFIEEEIINDDELIEEEQDVLEELIDSEI